MNDRLLRAQSLITRLFLWTTPIALTLLLATNFPDFEKNIWTTTVLAPTLAILFAAWLLSLLFVIFATFVSSRYKELVLHDVVLSRDRDEREELIAGKAAKKSILITLAASILILICTTGQYNKAENSEKSSITIGNFRLSENTPPMTTQADDGTTVTHYQLPMSKMSLVLLLILIQVSSYHAITFLSLKRMET